jgi:hypothetical protein
VNAAILGASPFSCAPESGRAAQTSSGPDANWRLGFLGLTGRPHYVQFREGCLFFPLSTKGFFPICKVAPYILRHAQLFEDAEIVMHGNDMDEISDAAFVKALVPAILGQCLATQEYHHL